MVGRGFVRDHLLLRAHSLTFLTVLSLVPLLALAVSVASLFGVQEDLPPILVERIAAGAPAAAEWLVGFVEDFQFGALGTLGGVALVATTVLMIGSIERSLNAIWGVQKQRTWVRRIPDYLAVLVVAPGLLGVAISLGTTLQSQWVVQRMLEVPGFDALLALGLGQAPTFLMVVGFAFVYWFLPNTDVRLMSALVGGLFAGVLFTLAQGVYLDFQVGAARYSTIFGALSVIPLFMVWVYFSWAITLLGAEVAFAYQTLPLYRREIREAGLGSAARESVGLALGLEIARAFRRGAEPPSDDELSEQLDVPVRTVRDLLRRLETAGIVSEVASESYPNTFQLGRPADTIHVADVIEALRGSRTTPRGDPALAKVVEEVFARLDRETAGASGARTLDEMVAAVAAEAPGSVDPPGAGE